MLNNRDEIQTSESTEEVVRYSVYEGIIKSGSTEVVFGFSDKAKPPILRLEISPFTGFHSGTIFKHKIKISWSKMFKMNIDHLIGRKVKLFITHAKKDGVIDSIINDIELIESEDERGILDEDKRYVSV